MTESTNFISQSSFFSFQFSVSVGIGSLKMGHFSCFFSVLGMEVSVALFYRKIIAAFCTKKNFTLFQISKFSF